MSAFRAVVFDLDGTLIDSAPSLHAAAAAMLTERGLPVPDLTAVKGFIGHGVGVLVERCLRWAGADPGVQTAALDRFLDFYGADPVAGTRVLPGARDALASLHADGLRLGVCTNKPERLARRILNALDLGPFAAVAGGDTLPVRKPDPAPLRHVAALLDTAPGAVLYVGDSVVDRRTARAARIAYVHVEGGYQSAPIPGLGSRERIVDLSHLPKWIKDSAAAPFANDSYS